jgi:DNA-binding transcriptional regulator YiaG
MTSMSWTPANHTATVAPATLRRLRRVAGWRQEDAAAWAGVSVRTWRRWEEGAIPGFVGRLLEALPTPLYHDTFTHDGDTPCKL